VKIPKAPFPYHIFVFHQDQTMLQANPDAGDASTSDSNGAGAWSAKSDTVTGKFVEIMADRTTRHFVSRGEISLRLKVNGNTLADTFQANFYDAAQRRLREPFSGTLEGWRVLP
jgi:hypothetical protein